MGRLRYLNLDSLSDRGEYQLGGEGDEEGRRRAQVTNLFSLIEVRSMRAGTKGMLESKKKNSKEMLMDWVMIILER